MNIVIIGPKASGKSTIGQELSKRLGIPYTETDDVIEAMYEKESSNKKSCKEIYDLVGEKGFREREKKAVEEIGRCDWNVVICGGSTFMSCENRNILRKNAIIVFCKSDTDTLWNRIKKKTGDVQGLNKKILMENYKKDGALKNEVYESYADIIIDSSQKSPVELAENLKNLIADEMAVRCTAGSTFGEIVRSTTFGESHGKGIGVVLEGIPAGIEITEEDIQKELDRRKPGQSRVTTPRKEDDKVHILSGIFEGKTTGAPIALVIYNKSFDSSKYEKIKNVFRPGHADFTFFHKYEHRDYRGGGRSSGRETASRVAAGAIAKKILLDQGIEIYAHAIEIAGIKATKTDYKTIEKNMVRCADDEAAPLMVAAIDKARGDCDSVGGIVKLEIHGVPAGLGDPVFAKLDARLTSAIMSLGAVKGVEVGKGFELTKCRGSESNDKMKDNKFSTNNSGGIIGGISNGQTVVIKVAVKPTPTIASEQETIDKEGNNVKISVIGHHDPCIVPRVIPAIESMAALVILDAKEIQARLMGNNKND